MFKGLAAFVQMLLNAVVNILNAVALLFPNSPFKIIENSGFADFLARINYFLPVYEFLVIAESWLVCVALYYAVAVVARWVKTIE